MAQDEDRPARDDATNDDGAYIVPPDEQDAALGASHDDSIFQRVRLLTSQQRQLLDGLLRGLDASDALREAGYKGRAGLNSLRNKIPDIMDRLGLTDEALIDKHLTPLLYAEETQFFQKDGIVCDQRTVAALGIRRAALDMALKLRGSYAANEDAEKEKLRDITVNIVHVGA
jgi:hypothetical protein